MPDTLYYDGICKLCAREIRTLRRRQLGHLEFADIHQLAPDASLPSRDTLLKRLHLRTAEGDWLIGLPATVRAWSHTPWGWVFRPLLWPGLRPLTDRIYQAWAERRYRRLYACSVCMGAEE